MCVCVCARALAYVDAYGPDTSTPLTRYIHAFHPIHPRLSPEARCRVSRRGIRTTRIHRRRRHARACECRARRLPKRNHNPNVMMRRASPHAHARSQTSTRARTRTRINLNDPTIHLLIEQEVPTKDLPHARVRAPPWPAVRVVPCRGPHGKLAPCTLMCGCTSCHPNAQAPSPCVHATPA